MLEAGLWAPLPRSYFTDGNFLTFDPPEPPADPAPCQSDEGRYTASGAPPQTCGGEDPSHRLGRKRPGNIPAAEGMARSSRLRAQVDHLPNMASGSSHHQQRRYSLAQVERE